MMNIIVDEFAGTGSCLLQQLANLKNVSCYLSISKEDTARIITEVQPEIILIRNNDPVKKAYINQLNSLYPKLLIFTYSDDPEPSAIVMVKDIRSNKCIPLSKIVNQ